MVLHERIGAHPTVRGRISTAVGCIQMYSGGHGFSRGGIENSNRQFSHRTLVAQIGYPYRLQLSAKPVKQPEAVVARLVGDERDTAAIGRPLGCGSIEN